MCKEIKIWLCLTGAGSCLVLAGLLAVTGCEDEKNKPPIVTGPTADQCCTENHALREALRTSQNESSLLLLRTAQAARMPVSDTAGGLTLKDLPDFVAGIVTERDALKTK